MSAAGAPPALGLASRTGFIALPLGALLVLAWTLATHRLPLSGSLDWVPALGLRFALRLDGLAALMLLMITGVGTAVFVYAGAYMAHGVSLRRLYVLLSCFMVAMVGCVLADDVLLFFTCWELTSLLSFLLVGFDHTSPASRRSAQQALLVTGSGGLALLAGLVLLTRQLGTSSITEMVARLPDATATPGLVAGVLLMVVGAFTKSAQLPFHFWLPNAMAAPTPVSAYLHSATMVKLGVYLLARFDAGLDGWTLWQVLLQTAGSATAAWGMVLALRERDLKRILAWSTVATLGTLVALVGLPGAGAALAVGGLLLAHALYKAPLFFVAGNLDHGTGTRVIDHFGGLRRAMPWTAAAALLAGMSMAGLPMSFGYAAKHLMSEAKQGGGVLPFVSLANTVFAAVAVAVAGVAAVRIFWRRATSDTVEEAHEGGPGLIVPPLALALVGIFLGLFPLQAKQLVEGAGDAMTPPAVSVQMQLGGDRAADLLSLSITLGAGLAIYLLWDPLHRVVDAMDRRLGRFGMAAHYERALHALPRLAAAVTRRVQHGRSPGYLALAVFTVSLGLAAVLWAAREVLVLPGWALPSWGQAGAVAMVLAGAVAAVCVRQRLALLLSAGLVGYGTALWCLFSGAPDVAFTQFVVETVFVIIVAAVLLALAQRGRPASVDERALRRSAALLAGGFASALTLLWLAVAALPFDDALSRWFGAHSVAAAHGRNVVNVLLVDFRALDTLGEISVVMLSLMAALPLLRRMRRP
jgi:multicomponent Na+:H+ antiporter subunit A